MTGTRDGQHFRFSVMEPLGCEGWGWNPSVSPQQAPAGGPIQGPAARLSILTMSQG